MIRRLTALASCLLMLLAAPLEALAVQGTVNTSSLILRQRASKTSRALVTLDRGDRLEVVSVSGDWYRVTYGRRSGYVMKKYVKVSGKVPSTDQPADDTPAANPAPSLDAIGSMPTRTLRPGATGTNVKKLQQALTLAGYYKGKINSRYDTATENAVRAFQKAKGLSRDGIAGPMTLGALWDQPQQTTSDSGMAGISSIGDIGTPPIRTLRPGATGTNVKKLQQALTLAGYYKGKINSRYDTATENAVRAFQKAKGLARDGIAGPMTLGALFATGLRTERLDWFRNGSATIPKGAVFTVKDCRTGKTFQAKRWSGAHHADSEPLTKQDTAALKAIYGGRWSWDRRPILVKYNGHVYAASMNGMPHGTTTVDNNFPGHICIHFYGSKTHESNKVDPDHKAAEAAAMKYTW